MMLIRTTGESVKFIGSKYIQESLINTTPNRPDYFLFFFCKKVRQKCWPIRANFISKQKQTTSLHQGWQWALKIAVWKILQLSADHHAEWPLCKLWTLCFSVPDLVYPPWNKPILDIPKSERSIVYLIRKWPMDSKFKIIIYCLSWWTSHLPHSGNDFLSFFFNNLFLLLPVSDCCGTGCFGKKGPESLFPRRYLYKIGSPSNCLR